MLSIITHKKCCKCKEIKTINLFHKDKSKKANKTTYIPILMGDFPTESITLILNNPQTKQGKL